MPNTIAPKIAQALAAAVTNDRHGAISRTDASKLVQSGLSEIASAADPAAVHASNARYIDAAKKLMGSDAATLKALDGYAARGEAAVLARQQTLTGEVQLPNAIRHDLLEVLYYGEIVPDGTPVSVSHVTGSATSGYLFDYTAEGATHQAHAVPYAGRFVLSPVALDKATLDAATAKMREHFDENFAPNMTDWSTPAEIAAARAAISPERAYFPGGASDPYAFTETYPIVLTFNNSTGSDHGFFVGIDPADPQHAEAYDFN